MTSPYEKLRGQSPQSAAGMIAQGHAAHLVRHGDARIQPAGAGRQAEKPSRKASELNPQKPAQNIAIRSQVVKTTNFPAMLAISAQPALGLPP
ncbi:hypothetical protein [Pseudomonas sp. AN-1]|uniref:hypothetical protein n=1 Tax=Pseudomonas sp. AN-1 TaxID=3096605 RepID=UPI002A6B2460|nr:hypothetical protein [Pseudomonas sp. AN-1]WPP43915.1 hypothetical protein SK095_11480 [Pseudomonas sp. AN-1]